MEYKTGETSNSTINYVYSDETLMSTSTLSASSDRIETLTDNSVALKRIGYYMALVMAVGFIGTLISLRGINKREQ